MGKGTVQRHKTTDQLEKSSYKVKPERHIQTSKSEKYFNLYNFENILT